MDKAKNKEAKSNVAIVDVISTAIKIPGVKVNRIGFLSEQFKSKSKEVLQAIIDNGPVNAGCTREEIKLIAVKLINQRTMMSTGASFVAGLPGGFAMAATIPADMLQFYGVALRMAQEISYLYGEGDLWAGEILDKEKVTNQLILYCGVMLGATGAAQTVRVVSSSLAKQALKKIPQQALTKTFYYPIIKSIAKALGFKMTKDIFAKGVNKVIPVIGGVVSGGITFATFRPMGTRLMKTLDEAHFAYTQAVFEEDWKDITKTCEEEKEEACEEAKTETVVDTNEASVLSKEIIETEDIIEKIKSAKQLLDDGIISEEEFTEMKNKYISKI